MIIWKKVKKNYFKNQNTNAHNSKKWLSIVSSRLKLNFLSLKNKDYLNEYLSSSPLPIMLVSENKNKVEIADFGSGSQEIFFQLSIMNLKKKKIKIDSIEVETLVKFLKKKKFNTKNLKINFLEEFNFEKKYDYVHIGNSLQYLTDWKNFLKKINFNEHKFIILNCSSIGKIKTYFAKQIFYGQEIPYTFFSIKEICKLLNNYDLVSNNLYLNKVLGKYGGVPQNNFKKVDRIGFPKTLIFKHKRI